jgi:DHA2 family multidrug resistance protein
MAAGADATTASSRAYVALAGLVRRQATMVSFVGIFEQVRAGLMAAGTDAVTATQRTYAVLHGMLMTQASIVSFVTLFRVLGVIFLLMIPLVALMRRPAKGTDAPAAH